EPVLTDGSNRRDEFLQISRLADVTIGAEFQRAFYVRLGLRSAEDHDRRALECRVSFNFSQDRAPIFAGQVKIEDDQVWQTHAGVLPAAAEKFHGLNAIVDRANFVGAGAAR